MTYLRQTNGTFFVWAFLSGLLLFGFAQMVQADERHHEYREFRDSRYHHDHVYPARGQFIEVLPRGHRVVFFGKTRFYFFGSVWYRPVGQRFLIVAPPIGLVVPFCPPYYTTVWVGGLPYYYANEVYYTQGPGGYVVVEPPSGEVNQVPPPTGPMPSGPPPSGPAPYGSPPSGPMPSGPAPYGPPPSSKMPPPPQMPANQIFIYPRQGQSPEKQADDRLECTNWAMTQTNFDPARPPARLPENQLMQKQADFHRAQSACLEGRGYTVR